jgi:exportin-5
MSRLLESMGRTALVRPDAGAALLHRLFAILAGLPTDDVKSPPARAKAAMMAGRTSQAARQRVCAAILGVCAAAPEVRTHTIPFFPPAPRAPDLSLTPPAGRLPTRF